MSEQGPHATGSENTKAGGREPVFLLPGVITAMIGVMVALMPERREGTALEFAAIAGAEMAAGQAEGELFALVELENKGIGQGVANARGVDILAVGGAARTANGIPVFVKRPGARFLHIFDPPRPIGRSPLGTRPPQPDFRKSVGQKRP